MVGEIQGREAAIIHARGRESASAAGIGAAFVEMYPRAAFAGWGAVVVVTRGDDEPLDILVTTPERVPASSLRHGLLANKVEEYCAGLGGDPFATLKQYEVKTDDPPHASSKGLDLGEAFPDSWREIFFAESSAPPDAT